MRMQLCSLEAFWDRFTIDNPEDENTCWTYRGPTVDINGRHYGLYCGERVHILAVAIYTGVIPGRIDRSCKNSLCVRREHVSNVGFKRPVPKYDPITGKPITVLAYDHPMMKDLVNFRLLQVPINHNALAHKYDVPVHLIKRAYAMSTIHTFIHLRKQCIAEDRPIPMTPTLTMDQYHEAIKNEVMANV